MSLLTRISSKLERRNLGDPQPWVVQLLGRGSQTTSGVWVNPDTALRFTAVFAAVRVIAESVAMLPLVVYRRDGKGGKDRAEDHPLFSTLHDQPNSFQTSFEFREMMTAHVLLRGNAYARIDRSTYDGRVLDLLPLHPDRIRPFRRQDGSIWYEYRPITGTVEVFSSDEMFHLKGLSTDGIVGVSPISMAREAVGLGMAFEEYFGRFFSNDATPPIVLKHPEALSEQAYGRLVQSVKERHSGLPNAHTPWVLEEGMTVEKVGVSPRDAMFIEGRKFQVTEIARIFRVPPHMVGDLDRATFSNIEQLSIDFVRYSLMPWIVRWQQALKMQLFSAKDAKCFAAFVLRELLLGDMAARTAYYASMRQWGNLSANEVRELEDLNPRDDPGGKDFLEPMNMIAQGDGGAKQPPANPKNAPALAPPGKQADDNSETDKEVKSLRAALRAAAAEKAHRILKKEADDLTRLSGKYPQAADFTREVETFYRERFSEAPLEHVRESRRRLADALGTNGVSEALASWEKDRIVALTETLYNLSIRGN